MSRRPLPKDIARAETAQTAKGYRAALHRLNPRMPDEVLDYFVDKRFHPKRLVGRLSPFVQELAVRKGTVGSIR